MTAVMPNVCKSTMMITTVVAKNNQSTNLDNGWTRITFVMIVFRFVDHVLQRLDIIYCISYRQLNLWE